jgi:hypothetical protein
VPQIIQVLADEPHGCGISTLSLRTSGSHRLLIGK